MMLKAAVVSYQLPLLAASYQNNKPQSFLNKLPHFGAKYPTFSLQVKNQERDSSILEKAAVIGNNDEHSSPERYAVVTGANRGIGLETVRQLATKGVTVVLTARDEKKGLEATSLLHNSGLSNVIFHQLHVLDPNSVDTLAKFVQSQFGRLDILVNNAGVSGVQVDEDGLRALKIDPTSWLSGKATNTVQGVIKQTYEMAEECLSINYYGVKRVTEALLPMLQRAPSGARIANVSSLRGELRRIPNQQTRSELANIETLSEEKVDKILQKFLGDLKRDALEANGWSLMLPAYSISKATLNAYTRILAKKYPHMCINCVHPGFVNTDINWHTGTMTLEEGAQGSLKLALLPKGGPTGCYFDRIQVVLAASIVSKSGKVLVSRQFLEMSRVRIEALLAAFSKLVDTGKEHTYVEIETEDVRYVYQPIEALYLVLVTN